MDLVQLSGYTDLEDRKVGVGEEVEDGEDCIVETAERRNLGTSWARSTAVIAQAPVQVVRGAGLEQGQRAWHVLLL